MKSNRTIVFVAVAIALMAFASSAMAETVHAQLVGLNPNWGAATLTQDGGAHWEAGGVGQLQWGNAVWSSGATQSTFWTYCIQINSQIYYNTFYDYTVAALSSSPDLTLIPPPGSGTDKANAIQCMFGWVRDNRNDLSSLTDIQKMALQIAVWEVVYDGRGTADTAWDLSGNFRISNYNGNLPAAITEANTYLRNDTYSVYMPLVGLVGSNQNQIITALPAAPPPPPPSIVPVPGTASAVGVLLGIGGCCGWRSRRRTFIN